MLRFALFSIAFFSLKLCAQPVPENFFTGKTIGNLPYLEYGQGNDRLGGAKMTYLDTNVTLRVVDSVRDRYKVQLSANHAAFLPKIFFKRDSVTNTQPYHLSSNWKVYGDSLFDYVVLSLDERLPYRSAQWLNPSRLVVDVYGVTSNTNWITQLSSAQEIKSVSYEAVEDDVFRVYIDLKHSQHWGYLIYYDQQKLVVRIKRQPPSLELSRLKVVIDAGHGGSNAGASGTITRILEKDYTLKFAKELQAALQQEGAAVVMTRDYDTTLSMNERWAIADSANPDFLISLHLNSSSKDSIRGVSTYYRYPGFRPLTQFVLNRLLETGLAEFGNVGSFNFTLNAPTEFPNCLVEVAFLSNRDDEREIRDPLFQKRVAERIVAGIKDWLASLTQ